MIAVIDANFFIEGKVGIYHYDVGYTTSLVWGEIKDSGSRVTAELYSYKIQIRDPLPRFLDEVRAVLEPKNLFLSDADMSLAALCVELREEDFDTWIDAQKVKLGTDVVCLTEDNALLQALGHFGVSTHRAVVERTYKIRCYACFALYDTYTDFCKRCSYPTMKRVSVTQTGTEIKLHLRKGMQIRPHVVKSRDGTVIRSADQKEYKAYKKSKDRKEKSAHIAGTQGFF